MATFSISPTDTADVQVLKVIIYNLVTVSDSVKIERKVDEQGVLLSVIVDEKDMGIIIGRNGSMATTIKMLMRAVGKANKMAVRVQFLEPDGSIRYTGHAAQQNGGNDQTGGSNSSTPYSHSTPKPSETAIPEDAGMSLEEDLKDFVIN